MEQRLFVLLLFTGVLPLVLSVRRKYHLILEKKSWDDALAYCRDTYVDLATIDSEVNTVRFQEEIQAQGFSSSAWTGLHTNINSWSWTFNNESLGSFTSWSTGKPDNAGGNDRCVCMKDGGFWFDALCEFQYSFVCFDDTKTGADRYILVAEFMSFDDAQSYCRQHYTDLASARDATENSAVGALNSGSYTWFGLRRKPLIWSDQNTDVSHLQFSSGSITTYTYNKSCGHFSGGTFNLAMCYVTKFFFCYSLPDRQQIIRLKVSSREDVNDPAVMAAILEKIEHKLKDHGLSANITIKWREQPDGLVFHKEEEENVL